MAVSDVKNNAKISPTVNANGRASGLDNCKSNPIIEIGLYRRMTRGICGRTRIGIGAWFRPKC